MISVGAFDGNPLRAFFSNFGNGIDFVAPGTSQLIYTTVPVEQGAYSDPQGTSVAAPVATGIAALLKSVNINLHRDDIESLLELSATDIQSEPVHAPGQSLPGYDNYTGFGRVNAGRALELLQAPYLLQQQIATNGSYQNMSGNGEWVTFDNDAGNSIAAGYYFCQMYEVTKTVNLP